MPKLREYKIFISHSWSNDQAHKVLQQKLKLAGYLNVEFEEATRDKPINSVDATYIKQALKKKINNSHIVLGLAGMYASHSEWMKWELETAHGTIPIVGVIPWGQERISKIVSDKSKENVRWNIDSIVTAIRKYAL